MKKNVLGHPLIRRVNLKFVIMVKMFWCLLLASVIQASAITTDTYSQGVKLRLKFEDATLEEIIWAMKKQSEFEFFYLSDDIKNVKGIDLEVEDASPEKVLDKCLENTNLSYEIVHKAVIIKKTAKPAIYSTLKTEDQKKEISGTVKDKNGMGIPGASIVVKSLASDKISAGIISDANGSFKLEIPAEADILVVSFVGMQTQELPIGSKTSFNVIMEDETVGLEEVVAIGYGVKKKINLTGAVSTVSGKVLTAAAPVSNVTNTLAGRLPGLIAKQTVGSPGKDAAWLSIRGFGNALIIVDGVEGSINNLDPNEIESVSVLKDASAAIYGARAGNGVILVTTKRGVMGKPTITLNSSYSQQRITNFPIPLTAGQFAEWTRENTTNKGLPESQQRFTEEQVQKYYDGTDPAFPSTDWYDLTVADYAPMHQHNLSINGGSDRIKYYGLIGYLDQESFWKNNGGGYKRYNVRSNLDAKITDNLSMQLGFSNINERRKFPVREGGGNDAALWQDLQLSEPVYASSFPDPTKLPFANVSTGGSILAASDMEKTGYNLYESQFVQSNLALKYDFPFVKGLSAKLFVNVAQNYWLDKNYSKPAPYYSYNTNTQEYTLRGTWSPQASVSETRGRSRTITNQFSFNYDRAFGDHNVSALALYESIDYMTDFNQASRQYFLTPAIEYIFGGSVKDQYANGSATEMGRVSYVGRLNYNYKNKYLGEITIRADASAKFPSETQWGYFPSFSAGWKISEEGFIKNNVAWIENLKLRGGFSNTGYDNVSNFAYLSGYQLKDNYMFTDNSNMPGLISTGLANPYLTWEELSIYNIGIDFSFFKSKLYGETDIFYRKREGIPTTRALSLPTTFGANLPPENLNSSNDRGFEFLLGTKGKNGDFTYDVSGNISWSRAKWDHFEEPDYYAPGVDPDLKRINERSGQWMDRVFGYKTDGLYTSMEEIAAMPFVQDVNTGNSTIRPGDVKFVDTNGDKVLNYKDQVEIGKGDRPHWMFGLNSYLTYKNFDLSALFQGASGHSVYMRTRVSNILFEEHWTEKNNRADAIYPRNGSIMQGGGFSNFTLKPGAYVRLKSLNIGYNLPQAWLKPVNIQNVRIYMAGSNLFTISELNKYGFDPEVATANYNNTSFTNSYYPQQRTFTLGINITL